MVKSSEYSERQSLTRWEALGLKPGLTLSGPVGPRLARMSSTQEHGPSYEKCRSLRGPAEPGKPL